MVICYTEIANEYVWNIVHQGREQGMHRNIGENPQKPWLEDGGEWMKG